ncbi:hypothetical protein JI435_405780 [Parastagonospora nodorum SN15]|uniref:Uncharacterized protein n=1 Tax=Phaeosphaeria nodorum (strain SN15 / ATCC MYA-4574 / FGSC 10173) TaxID=321614 RepID=A0A7U2EWL0_PHANO|nr:hypothetical protein JI435_405780 [Parastagonospora nodorum SN15]
MDIIQLHTKHHHNPASPSSDVGLEKKSLPYTKLSSISNKCGIVQIEYLSYEHVAGVKSE